MLKCPVCGATYRSSSKLEEQEYVREITCKRCKVDLSELIHVHDQAIWYHRKALDLYQQKDYLAAQTANDQALALYSHHAEFSALAGKLFALQGDFRQAIAAWRRAIAIDPQQEVASRCLQMIEEIKASTTHDHN